MSNSNTFADRIITAAELGLTNEPEQRHEYAVAILEQLRAESEHSNGSIVLRDGSITHEHHLRAGDLVLHSAPAQLGMTPGGPGSEWEALDADGEIIESEVEMLANSDMCDLSRYIYSVNDGTLQPM